MFALLLVHVPYTLHTPKIIIIYSHGYNVRKGRLYCISDKLQVTFGILLLVKLHFHKLDSKEECEP